MHLEQRCCSRLLARTCSQNSKNPSSVTRKSSIYRKGGTDKLLKYRCQSCQRGNTTEVTLQSHPKARSVSTQRKPLLFLEPCTSYFSLSNGKKQCLTGNGAVQKTADATTLSYWNEKQIAALLLFQVLMTHRDAMFNHHTSWGGIIKHLKRSF